MVGQLIANNNGKWKVSKVPLNPGYNTITFRSKTGLNDMSEASLPLVVHYDQTPPVFDIELNIINDKVSIVLLSNEALKKARLVSGNSRQKFKKIEENLFDCEQIGR